nr:hypothetical protein [Heyndrickxia oleronia]
MIMSRENQLKLSDFVKKDQFELSSYLTYLFHQFYDAYPSDMQINNK